MVVYGLFTLTVTETDTDDETKIEVKMVQYPIISVVELVSRSQSQCIINTSTQSYVNHFSIGLGICFGVCVNTP